MNIREMLEKTLKDQGFSGLVSEYEECGCEIGDLAPCESDFMNCKPGHKIPCTCGGGCDFHITTVRPGTDRRICPECGADIIDDGGSCFYCETKPDIAQPDLSTGTSQPVDQ